MNGHAGLTGAYPDPGKGRAVCNPGANGRRNIVIDSQGLTGTQDGSQRINPHAGKSSMGHVRERWGRVVLGACNLSLPSAPP